MIRQRVEANLGLERVRIVERVWGGSRLSILIKEKSSSFATKRKTLEAQQWPLWYFSLQLKHRPCSQREAISSKDKHLRTGGSKCGGEGRSGVGVETEREGTTGAVGGGLP